MMHAIRGALVFSACCGAVLIATRSATAQSQQWIHQLGTSGNDHAWAAAMDGAGGVYLSGTTPGNLGGPQSGGGDVWLARYDNAGNQLWIRQFGTSAVDWADAAAPDGSGGVYVGGLTDGSLGRPSAGSYDAWLARYDGAGNQLWIRQLGTSASDEVNGAALNGSDGVYISGRTQGSLGGPSAGGYDAWLARYDSAGNQLWIRQLGTGNDDHAYGAAPDGAGGAHISGVTDGSLGGPNAGLNDAWLARYDNAGNQLWIRQLGTSAQDYAFAAAPDGSGGVYLGGPTQGSLGGPSAGGNDAWYARYNSAGHLLWVQQFGTSTSDWASAATSDGSGGVYIAGHTYGSLGGPNAGLNDAWFAHFDSAGNQLGAHQLGTSTFDEVRAAAPDGSGGVYVGGDTQGSLSGPNAGLRDAWLARYDGGCQTQTTYCTAKPNSLGCVPAISLTGAPSASAGSGCTLSTVHLLGQESGLFFHSTSGAATAAFHGGVLCVQAPIRRHAPRASGGTAGACDGLLSEDFNAYIASGADPALVAGAQVWIQTWSRDPAAAFGDSLSDAVTATICP